MVFVFQSHDSTKRRAHMYTTFLTDDFFGLRVEINLYLIEARRQAHNKPINTLSDLVHAGERLRNL